MRKGKLGVTESNGPLVRMLGIASLWRNVVPGTADVSINYVYFGPKISTIII